MRLGKEPVETSIAMPSNASSYRSRYLAIGCLPSEVSLAFKPIYELTLGSKRRAKEARKFVVGLLKGRRIKPWRAGEEIRASILLHAADKLPDHLFKIDAALDTFSQAAATSAGRRGNSGDNAPRAAALGKRWAIAAIWSGLLCTRATVPLFPLTSCRANRGTSPTTEDD